MTYNRKNQRYFLKPMELFKMFSSNVREDRGHQQTPEKHLLKTYSENLKKSVRQAVRELGLLKTSSYRILKGLYWKSNIPCQSTLSIKIIRTRKYYCIYTFLTHCIYILIIIVDIFSSLPTTEHTSKIFAQRNLILYAYMW